MAIGLTAATGPKNFWRAATCSGGLRAEKWFSVRLLTAKLCVTIPRVGTASAETAMLLTQKWQKSRPAALQQPRIQGQLCSADPAARLANLAPIHSQPCQSQAAAMIASNKKPGIAGLVVLLITES